MSKSTFVIHHYEVSPYAEKLRAMFGLAEQAWGSVLSPPYPPRPNVDPLAGGYRRIPVAHIGADVFCDSSLIAQEVATHTGNADLAPCFQDPAAKSLAERAEGDVFFSAVTGASPGKLLGKLLLTSGLRGTFNFVRDRTGMMKGASVRPPKGKEAARVLNQFLADLDTHLAGRAWVDCERTSYADFCVYHPIWLAQSVGSAVTLNRYQNVLGWLQRMDALGEGSRREMRPDEAFKEAREAEPRPLPENVEEHTCLGREVVVAPDDYGKTGVSGKLVAATPTRLILARKTDHLGDLHVHFPQAGYKVLAQGGS